MVPRHLLLLLTSTLCLTAQQTAPLRPEDPVIRSDVREVVLDVVVRNKSLSLEKRLAASDFTITEDGVPQVIKSFRFVAGDTATETRAAEAMPAGPAVRSAAATVNSTRQPRFVAIVLEGMSFESRANAVDAARAFLSKELDSNTYVAIFRSNLRMGPIQTFTNDRTALLAAVNIGVRGSSQEIAKAMDQVQNQSTYTITGGQGGVSVNSTNDPLQNASLATSGASSAALSESQQAMAAAETAQMQMVTNIAGSNIIDQLKTLSQALGRLPGRKVVLYLTEGMNRPATDSFRSLISIANRGNVSFYCVDVRGITMASPLSASTQALSAVAATARANVSSGGSPASAAATMQLSKEFDLIDTALNSAVDLNMDELATSTGGFSVFGTNSFDGAMARLREDIRIHYEISYVSTTIVYDGHFRKIVVTVNKPKLTVQSRDGYYALPEGAVEPFEIQGLKALAAAPRHDFTYRSAALRYRPLPIGSRYEVAFDVNTGELTTPVDILTHKARLHAIFFALIRKPNGEVAARVSREIDRNVPEEKLAQFRKGEMIFTIPVDLPLGRYTIDSAVIDPEGNRSSTKRQALVVTQNSKLTLSDLTLVHRLEPVGEKPDTLNPLEFQGGRVLPEVTQKANPQGLSLYFVVYPSTPDKPKVSLDFFRDGQQVSHTDIDPGPPDASNTFPILATAKLPPGEYTARVTVEQGGRTVRESAPITVAAN